MSEQMSTLAIALALTAKHIEPVEPVIVPDPPLRSSEDKADPLYHKHSSKKVIHNRRRNKIAAASRKRNRR